MVAYDIRYAVDLEKQIQRSVLAMPLIRQDKLAHQFRISVTRGGEAVTISAVTATFMRSDGSTVAMTGTAEGNVAVVTLVESCYVSQGDATLTVKISDGTQIASVLYLKCVVLLNSTDVIIDPGTVVPSLDELLAQIETMRTATSAATEAADDAETAAAGAGVARDAAIVAAQGADQAAAAATGAASGATAAAQAASSAAGEATSAAGSAIAAAQAAGQAATGATEAATAANSAATAATTAAGTATTAAGQATSAATTATQAAQAASAAATEAGQAASAAEGATTAANAAASTANTAAQAATEAAQDAEEAAEEARQAVKIETVKLNGTPLTPDAQKAVNVTAVQQSDLATYSLISETGSRIDLELNTSTYVLVAKLYDKNDNLISTSTGIDLPIEEMIVNVTYDSTTKELVITLKSGTVVRVPIGDIISGLATQTWVTSGFVAKETGKGLSTNDYSNTEKTKLAALNKSDANPQMDGTAAPGTSADLSRADHVHPTNTTLSNAIYDNDIATLLLLNFARQNAWNIERGTVTLTNTQSYPFNDSAQTIAFEIEREPGKYLVIAEAPHDTINVGEIYVYDKLANGFKIEYTGSARSAVINYTVLGGELK